MSVEQVGLQVKEYSDTARETIESNRKNRPERELLIHNDSQ